MKKTLKRGFTLIELMIVVAIIGILAAIAIPNFIKFQARSKQGEAKANLKALFTAQKSYLQEKDRYSIFANELGFAPERGNRYYYEIGDTGSAPETRNLAALPVGGFNAIEVDIFKYPTQPDGTTATLPAPPMSVTGGMPNGGAAGIYQVGSKSEFTHTAVGNIDNDAAAGTGYDQWYISSESAEVTVLACTESDTLDQVSSGVPGNMHNDVNCE